MLEILIYRFFGTEKIEFVKKPKKSTFDNYA